VENGAAFSTRIPAPARRHAFLDFTAQCPDRLLTQPIDARIGGKELAVVFHPTVIACC